MTKKLYVGVAIIVAAIVGGLWYAATLMVAGDVIDKDTTVSGDYVVNKALIIKNGAKLTVEGSMTVNREVNCQDGPLNITVKGAFIMDGRLNCYRRDTDLSREATGLGINLALLDSVSFGKDSQVTTNGHVQIMDDPNKLLSRQDQIDALYNDVAQPTGTGKRVGPLLPKASGTAYEPVKMVYSPVESSDIELPAVDAGFSLIKTARAQGPVPVRIGGNWVIGDGEAAPANIRVPTPPRGINRIILNFDFGRDRNVEVNNLDLYGPDGIRGDDDRGKNCNARATDGKDAMRMNIRAVNLTINAFNLNLGNGGDGGDAETPTNCDPASATAGRGGDSGNFKFIATDNFNIAGEFNLYPGNPGNGGHASATGKDGKDGCPGEKGGDATAVAGAGANQKKDLAVAGTVDGTHNIRVGASRGGHGGIATAKGGKGGNGTGAGCNGGQGGQAVTTGGKGGDASVTVVNANPAETSGGNGGNVNSFGGNGGNGGNCQVPGSAGGNGGNGGNATATAGKGGKGDDRPGQDGEVKNQPGGNGGNGGVGGGAGGAGGAGNPNGKPGADGQPGCPLPTNTNTGVIPTPPVLPPTPPVAPPTSVQPSVSMTFAHVQPGVYSEVYTTVRGLVGAAVMCNITGPGVVSGGQQTGIIGTNGEVRFTTRINRIGRYNANCTVNGTPVSGSVNVN